MPRLSLAGTKINSDSVQSPCVRNCCLDDNDICMGCFRHVDEIVCWGSASNDEQRQILLNADQRRVLKQSLSSS